MRPIAKWWQDYVAGRLTTPRALTSAVWSETPDPAQASDRFFDVPDPGDRFDAPQRLAAPLHFKSEAYMRQVRRADWSHCDPRLIVWAALFQHMARKRNIPLYVHCALRGRVAQAELLKQGRSKAGYPRSAHNIGEAVDIVHGVWHWDLNRVEWQFLSVLGRLALDRLNATLRKDNKLHLQWGGEWRFYDPAHWEIKDYRTRLRVLSDPLEAVRYPPQLALSKRNELLRGL